MPLDTMWCLVCNAVRLSPVFLLSCAIQCQAADAERTPVCHAFVQAYKNKGEKYKVIWPEEPEFVRVAARFGATIIPVGAVGCEDRCAALPPGPCYHPISAALPGHARQHGGWDQVCMSVGARSTLCMPVASCGHICWSTASSALRLQR